MKVLIHPISIVTPLVECQWRRSSGLMAGHPTMRYEYRAWVDRGYADGNEWGFLFSRRRDSAQCAEIRLLGFPEERLVVREDQTAAKALSKTSQMRV